MHPVLDIADVLIKLLIAHVSAEGADPLASVEIIAFDSLETRQEIDAFHVPSFSVISDQVFKSPRSGDRAPDEDTERKVGTGGVPMRQATTPALSQRTDSDF
jgi:hypothetical protein